VDNVLITGGAGYVGTRLTPQLLAAGHRVTVYDTMYYGCYLEPAPGLRIIEADIRDTETFRDACRGADAVIHLACISNDPSFEMDPSLGKSINYDAFFPLVRQSKKHGVKRFVYASSVAAYGFHRDNPQPLREDTAARGTDGHYYSAQKAEVEAMLWRTLRGSSTAAYVFRPCVVAGRDAPLLIDNLPYTQISKRLPGALRGLLGSVPLVAPVLPDPGVPFQLVHHDDVASAMRAAVLGRGRPGVYNLAGPGTLTLAKLAAELGWHSVPIPRAGVDLVAETVSRLGFLPAQVQWISAFREPVIMDTAKARRELRWRPRHTALQVLRETIAATRDAG